MSNGIAIYSLRDKKIKCKIGDREWRQVATTFQSIFQFAVITIVVTQGNAIRAEKKRSKEFFPLKAGD